MLQGKREDKWKDVSELGFLYDGLFDSDGDQWVRRRTSFCCRCTEMMFSCSGKSEAQGEG